MAAIETAREVCRNAAQACPGIATYCVTRVRFGVVEAVNANIRMLINRGRSYQNLRYLLLKAKRVAMTNVEFLAVRWVAKAA
jgi:hypothetical protein